MDSSALVAFLENEPGGDVVEALLLDTGNTCYAHAVNLCETYYFFHRKGGEAAAQTAFATLLDASVVPREDMDLNFWQEVGRLKSPRRNIPLGDCFCVALAQRIQGEVVTSDHLDFDPIAQQGLCPVRFIR
jgi:PIN domain nuclease of toxin-antitoxin system